MKYVVQKSFSLRVRKTDGTAKMMAGITGITGDARIGRIIKLPIGKDDVLVAKIIAKPGALDEPWEAT